MHSKSLIGLTACALAAISSPLSAQGGNATSASRAVQEYIRAASDSNLSRMAELFGTDKGNAIHLHMPNLEKRMVITQAYLSKAVVRTLGEVPGAKGNERSVTTEVAVGQCKVVLAVTAVQSSKDGWLVRDLNLDKLKDLRSPCQGSGQGNLRD